MCAMETTPAALLDMDEEQEITRPMDAAEAPHTLTGK